MDARQGDPGRTGKSPAPDVEPGTPTAPEPTPDPEPVPFVVDISDWQAGITAVITRQWSTDAAVNHGIVKMGGGNAGIYELSTHRPQVTALREAGIPASRYWFNGQDGTIGAQVTAARSYLAALPLAVLERFMWDAENEEEDGVIYTRRWTPGEVESACRQLADMVPFNRQVTYLSSSATRGSDWSAIAGLGVMLSVADYGLNNGSPSSVPLVAHWRRDQIWIWQYTSKGQLPGYPGDLDLNTGDLSRLWTVFELQEALNKLVGAGLVVDGDPGRRTYAAVGEFQETRGLKVDQIPGTSTLTELAGLVGWPGEVTG